MDEELYWAKLAAMGQIAGAVATFLAVLVSLYIAYSGRKPRVRLVVGERLILGTDLELRVLTFSVANTGERPVHVRGFGWVTGWIRWGPKWLRRQAAVQLLGSPGLGDTPPFELQAGQEKSCHAEMENVLTYAREREKDPLFIRKYPLFGPRQTRVRAYVYTADAHTIHVKPEKPLVKALQEAERRGLSEEADAAR